MFQRREYCTDSREYMKRESTTGKHQKLAGEDGAVVIEATLSVTFFMFVIIINVNIKLYKSSKIKMYKFSNCPS